MRPLTSFQKIEDSIERLAQGAFLVVKNKEGKTNIMTIGWGLFGILFRKPVLMIAVRPSRYTFSFIETADDFTVAIPFSNMSKEIALCGSKSGRICDKWKLCGLAAAPAQKTRSPILKIPGRFYECILLQAAKMDEKRLDARLDKEIYTDKSYHTFYFGEIAAAYESTSS
jgi:flavin reductase (DIM6/NTAB) family NADH-FMN oxidoreductase RutF